MKQAVLNIVGRRICGVIAASASPSQPASEGPQHQLFIVFADTHYELFSRDEFEWSPIVESSGFQQVREAASVRHIVYERQDESLVDESYCATEECQEAPGLVGIVGKRIQGIIATGGSSQTVTQLHLIFTDETHFTIRSTRSQLESIGAVDPGGFSAVLNLSVRYPPQIAHCAPL